MTVYNFLVVLFQYYSVWIFHILANIILLTDTRDLLTVSLIVAENVIAIIHIMIWNRSGSHPYKLIYRTWVVSFYLVVVYGFSRYILFFLKYTSVRYLFMSSELIDVNQAKNLNTHLFKSVNMLDQNRLHDVAIFFHAFIRPLMLLSLAVLTRETFLKTFIDVQDKKRKSAAPRMTDLSLDNIANIIKGGQNRNLQQ